MVVYKVDRLLRRRYLIIAAEDAFGHQRVEDNALRLLIAGLFFRRWRRRLRGAARSFFNPKGPMRFDLLALRFRRDKYAAGFLAQLLRHLIRYRTRLLIVGGRNDAETAHAHLHRAWFNLANASKIGFDDWKCSAHCFAVCWLRGEIFCPNLSHRRPPAG